MNFAKGPPIYVDHNVIAFLRQIRHLFEKETKIALDIRVNKKCVWALLARDIWPLLVGGISRLDCLSGVRFPDDQRLVLLRRHIASKALRDCAKLRVVECFGILPEAPADDRASATVGQALCMWLHTPLMDGRPKLLKCVAKDGQFLENVLQLKRSFVGTASPVSYIIRLSGLSDSDLEPFKLENHKTRERLSAQNVRHTFWLFERSPIVRDEKQWAVWEREAIGRKWWNSENNVLSLAIGPKDIGPLCDRPRRQRTAGHKGVDLMSVN
uniref:PINc domain-containing protein n=1 Tax=Globodera pallida TaxID=36090 RepID=A0A183BW88_GLOPA